MIILQLFGDLDELILRTFGDLDSAFRTDRGEQLLQQILANENRDQLRAWYKRDLGTRQLNGLASSIKQKLEAELGEEL